MPLPSGARDGSIVSGWPTTTVASAGQQAALRLVDRARDAVEARRQVHDRRLAEPLVAVPARRLGEREVDLHLGAAVPEAASALAERRRDLDLGEEPLVQLRRRHVRDHRAARVDPLAVRQHDAGRAPRPDVDALDVAPGLARAAVVADQLHERRRAASRRRRAEPACRPPAPRPRSPAPCSPRPHRRGRAPCAAPRERAGRAPAPTRTPSRASRGRPRACRPRTPPHRRARAGAPPSRPSPSPAPPQSSVPSTPNARSAFGKNPASISRHACPSPDVVPIELHRVRVGGAQQERRLAVGIRRRRRQVGVQVLEPARRQLGAEQAREPPRRPTAGARH